jgi:hypothetical protein
MKANLSLYVSAIAVALVASACGDDPDQLTGRGKNNPDPGTEPGPTDPAPTDPTDPALCKSREYVGFDASPLHATRIVAKIGVDRGRLKPFTALQTEYARVLGAAPASLQGAGPTFGQVPQRWYEEPQANAVALQTAYNIAFDGCLEHTKAAPEFAAAPDAASAATQCGAMARKFWSKTPAPQEIDACVNVAITGAASEAQPRRKWAYACASVLSSAGFLTF